MGYGINPIGVLKSPMGLIRKMLKNGVLKCRLLDWSNRWAEDTYTIPLVSLSQLSNLYLRIEFVTHQDQKMAMGSIQLGKLQYLSDWFLRLLKIISGESFGSMVIEYGIIFTGVSKVPFWLITYMCPQVTYGIDPSNIENLIRFG